MDEYSKFMNTSIIYPQESKKSFKNFSIDLEKYGKSVVMLW
jgi:hypothetical protein